jgi:hypothetical protein
MLLQARRKHQVPPVYRARNSGDPASHIEPGVPQLGGTQEKVSQQLSPERRVAAGCPCPQTQRNSGPATGSQRSVGRGHHERGVRKSRDCVYPELSSLLCGSSALNQGETQPQAQELTRGTTHR